MNQAQRFPRRWVLAFLLCFGCSRGAPSSSACCAGQPASPALTAPAATLASSAGSGAGPAGALSAQGLPPGLTSMGTNLGGINDVSEDWAFADAFKQARPWISGEKDGQWADKRPLAQDERGWVRALLPNQVAHTLVFGGNTHFPSGNYIVTWKGKGKLDYFITGGVLVTTPGREVVSVQASPKGFGIDLVETDPSDPLRDIHVYMPGGVCEGDAFTACITPAECGGRACKSFDKHPEITFYPAFLQSLRGYGALRFMDWFLTNDSKQKSWSGRPELVDATYTAKGVPLEAALELLRVLNVDGWFTVPHLADDDYVRNMARVIKDGMPKGRKAYVEHSNEVWNDMFEQARYATAQGRALGLSRDEYEARLLFNTRRSRHIFSLFTSVYGTDRSYVRVLASHGPVDWSSLRSLEFEDTAKQVDALAIAPYFGGSLGADDAARVRKMTLDELFTTLSRESVPTAMGYIQKNAELARRFKVKLLGYEGGQHMVGVGRSQTDEALNRLFDAANRDPRIKALYRTYLQAWKDNGGELFMHYQNCGPYTEWGRWGAREWMSQPRPLAPKYDALMEFATTHPRWW